MERIVSRNHNALTLRCVTFDGQTGDNAGMDIQLNGEPRRLDAAATIAALLEREGLATRRVAVEVNGEIVPRGRHPDHLLQDGDRVEIVHALGGG